MDFYGQNQENYERNYGYTLNLFIGFTEVKLDNWPIISYTLLYLVSRKGFLFLRAQRKPHKL